MFSRILNFQETLKDHSILLLGPRQTGKSTLLKSLYPNSQVFDLLTPELFRDLNKSPSLFKEMILFEGGAPIIVDEIQKLPELLDVVQSLMAQNKSYRFILTGSSARKLRKAGQNLLGGRAYPLTLHPMTYFEYVTLAKNNKNHWEDLLQMGGLPSVLTSSSPQKTLKSYVGIYLQEEIKAEGFARNLSDFSKFLDVAALTNGEQLDFSGVGRDVQISPRTVASYYSILQDTLIGYLLEPFRMTRTRKAVTTPKFYYFDVGVSNFLTGREKLSPGTPEYGKALEHFIFTELTAYRNYKEKNFELYYWRSTSQFEVDFIIKIKNTKKIIGIEVKGSSHIDKDDLKGLKAFEDDFKLFKKILVCNEKLERRINDQYQILPVQKFCEALWADKIIQ